MSSQEIGKATIGFCLGLVMGIVGMVAGFSGAVLGGLEAGNTLTRAQDAFLFSGYSLAALAVGTVLCSGRITHAGADEPAPPSRRARLGAPVRPWL